MMLLSMLGNSAKDKYSYTFVIIAVTFDDSWLRNLQIGILGDVVVLVCRSSQDLLLLSRAMSLFGFSFTLFMYQQTFERRTLFAYMGRLRCVYSKWDVHKDVTKGDFKLSILVVISSDYVLFMYEIFAFFLGYRPL